jgi:hypothetical protein
MMSFCRIDGELEWAALDGGPMGGKGLDDSDTALGLIRKLDELESRLVAAEGVVELAIDLRSAASSTSDRATDFFGLETELGIDWELVKVRVKYVCRSSTSHTVMIILA